MLKLQKHQYKVIFADENVAKSISDLESGIEIPDCELGLNGYRKVDLEDNIVKKVALSQEEMEWFEDHYKLPFAMDIEDTKKSADDSFVYSAHRFVTQNCDVTYRETMERLCKAYFNGYYLEEKTYYLEIHGHDSNERYLAINTETGKWFLVDGSDTPEMKSLFTNKELEELSEDPNFSWLSVDNAKVLAPKDDWIIESR